MLVPSRRTWWSIPAAAANLTALRSVNLAYSRLHGGIPASLGPRRARSRTSPSSASTATAFRADGPHPGHRDRPQPPPRGAAPGHLRRRGLRRRGPRQQPAHGRRVGAVRRREEAAERAARLSRNRFEFDLGRLELP